VPQAELRREEAPIGEIAAGPDREPRHDGVLPAPAAIFDDEEATPVAAASTPDEDRPIASSPRRTVSAATPDVLRNIEEAALIRQRLPQHMAMLLRIPTNEVAQNSYKSPFRETREDLIGRLLDPQLTLEEAARMLGVCPTTVRRYTNRGMLHCHRTPGNQRRFRMSDVLQFLEQYGDRIDRAAEARQMETAA
jgi:excisionase family DNA binding protein